MKVRGMSRFIRTKSIMLFALLVAGVASSAIAESELSIATGTFAESNTFYADVGERGDGVARIKPHLKHESQGSIFGFKTDLTGSYNKHVKFYNQDYFDYQGQVALPVNPNGKFGMELSGNYKKISEPAVTDVLYTTSVKKDASRIERQQAGGDLGIHLWTSSLSLIKLKGGIQLEAYEDASHQYLSNQGYQGSLYYDYQFLPETVFYVGGESGILSYPDGLKNKDVTVTRQDQSIQSKIKNDSIYYSGRAGVKGRLAERTRIEASGAILIREYAAGSSFSEPVFNLGVEEQFSPKDLLSAGYDYDVNDSKFTNYVVDQTTYVGYARILGDQVLFLTRLQYTYSSYSAKPFRRDDQKLAGSFKVDYSVNPKSKISAMIDLDVLNSDQINTFEVDGKVDPAYSYQYFRLGLEWTQYF